MGWIDRRAAALGLTSQRMPSGAGHDAQEIAHIAPMAMIFVPSVAGSATRRASSPRPRTSSTASTSC